ncbi:hypothetical protein PC116_g1034 [Phytophthora cactorum]|uniref:Uncharacterized protein n=1 Tax=Phytophthora cactorum TaxID=29920 RepID=A0A8T1FNC2_9STRA|nr:hypothetical protein Pcac1_g3041 [Phytophthora cactorum]KAG3110580.1 hypothetical protein PI125_g9893 [Phytophthora idaei]KAG2821765.1 hypothetical protein PC112_g11219 [Phytophthora cactorum]KAG2835656.1 hypothetical protein PC111_g5335 [Phytophthora cactorum]KAG2864356.1 hypothetical protein PC113_g4665 [Phytophthora cactorum]
MAEIKETVARKAKDIVQEIPGEYVPEDAQPVDTMWVYTLKSDTEGM